MNIITEQNKYGEKIHIKLDDEIVMVHHEDCTENYITLNDLILKHILSVDEILSVINASKKLYLPILLENSNK